MDIVTVKPGRLSQFGPSEGAVFCLITNPEITDQIVIEPSAAYSDVMRIMYGPDDDLDELFLHHVPQNSHILSISPERFFSSPDPSVLGERRKLIAMACNSTPTSLETISHFLRVIEKTSAVEQGEFSDRFFDAAEETEYLEYVDERHGTSAILQHLAEGLVWNQQAGPLEWGEQQIVPPGEISVLPIEIREFDTAVSLPLNGQITLRGHPILHNGTPSFTRADQQRVRDELAAMEDHAVIADVVGGRITAIRPYEDGSTPAVRMLEAMFAVDSRYRHVWEIGHALNTSLELLPGNHAMNEVYGGTHGCLHWGIGLTPFTQYHLDVISPGTTVLDDRGRVILGVKGGYSAAEMAIARS
jgi:hypothetical protein